MQCFMPPRAKPASLPAPKTFPTPTVATSSHTRDMDIDPEAEHMSKARSCYSSLQASRIAGTWPGLLLLGQEVSLSFSLLLSCTDHLR